MQGYAIQPNIIVCEKLIWPASINFLQLMGNNQSQSQRAIQQGTNKQEKLLSPIQRWISSDQSIQDVINLFKDNQSFSSSSNAILQFIKSIVNKEKYQSYILGLLQYLGGEQARSRFEDYQRKQLYTHLFKKLKYSFFVRQDFNEAAINYSLTPSEMLEILYQNCQSNEQMVIKAIGFNIDSIFQGFKQFIQIVVELQIIVSNQQNLFRLIIPYSKIQGARLNAEINARSLIDDQRANLLQNLQLSNYVKQFYIQGFKQLLKYDYADLTSKLFRQLKVKGYWLTQEELIQQLKIEIYSLYLYDHCKLSISYDWIQCQTIRQILHHFYSNFELEDTPALIKCFCAFQDPNQKWHYYALDYLFSDNSLTTTFVRLVQKKYVSFENSQLQFSKLLLKIRKSRTDIGKLSFQLCNLIQGFDVKYLEKNKYNKLIKLVEICFYFGIQQQVQFLYKIVYTNWENPSHEQLLAIQSNGLALIKSLITNYFVKFDLKMKVITIQDRQFQFSTIFQMLKFIQFLKKYFLNDFINNCVTHQIFFCELIKNQRYIEIKALLSEQKQNLFKIELQTIQMIIIDHLIKLITKTKIKKNQDSIKILLNIVKLYNSNPIAGFHYVLSYYYYFKYLEEKDIALPQKMKQKVSVQILYYIVDHYPEKIESVDFNFLFTHQSCINNHYTDININFIAVVTDQFLKFKIYLSRKAFFQRKINLGNEAIEEVIRCQPPWISTQLVKILRQNPNVSSQEKKFLQIAFNYCAKGEDLDYIINLYSNLKQSKRSSFLKLSSWTSILKEDKYLLLTQQIVLSQPLYENHVAERTFNYKEDKSIKSNNYLFFYMMSVEPDQAFSYAINYNMPVDFVVDFMLDGARKNIFHLTNIFSVTLRYLFYQLTKEKQNISYIPYKTYKKYKVDQLCRKSFKIQSQTNTHFQKFVKNYQVSKIITQQFIDLYLNQSILFSFMHDEIFRKKVLVDLRQQPMTKSNSKILKSLCEKAKIDILQLSIYNLMSKVNSKQILDDQCWTICQKFIYWGEEMQIALSLVKRLSQKIEILQILVSIFDYLRESQSNFKLIITDYHLNIIRSLAAVEVQKNLHGIIPEDFFQREIGPNQMKQRGKLSENHRKILGKQACVQNIFVISKALYFMYGCNEEVEKIILGQFSLKQNDSEEFQILRKKIKSQNS